MTTPAPYWHSRGYLPHFEGGETPQCVTFRLADSFPVRLLEEWRAQLARLPATREAEERGRRIDAYLDTGKGACYLASPPIARLVQHALLFFDGSRYRLHCWVVMPNHVHAIVTPLGGRPLAGIVHSWKSFSGREASRTLGKSGPFWQREYYDRAIRDARHFLKAVEYIEGNPVKANLCKRAEDWPFGSRRLQRDA